MYCISLCIEALQNVHWTPTEFWRACDRRSRTRDVQAQQGDEKTWNLSHMKLITIDRRI
jgi:hypothetical protein